MSVLENVVGSLLRVIRLNDRIDGLAREVAQQQRIVEDLTHRVIRLEAALELMLGQSAVRTLARRRLPKPAR
jgi:cell division protein FtsB